MIHLAALPVVLPLLLAAILAGLGGFLPRWLLDATAWLTSIAVLVICCCLVEQSSHGTIVYWFGSWKPDAAHFPVGICFMIDPIGAGLAALVSLLMLAAFTFSWSYFKSIKSLYHALMLVFLAAMCGLCLTGDLFNLFVWFELMTATAVGLCGYKSEESWPLLGALNFAVTNTVGAFLTLAGIALIYAYTGSLNMSQVAQSLAVHSPGHIFIAIAFLFVIAGFLVKSAAFPFQFWLADAHAVAPTPVCILFSGVMVELGLYAIARLYWVIFAPLFDPHADAIRTVFLTMGSVTAVVGAIYCYGQRHLKRLLAFSTISHMGLMFIGFALLKGTALAGLAMYVLGHGMIKGTLFICAGILLHRFESVDEHDLRGQGKKIWPVSILMLIAALGLAGLPPFATFFGQSWIDHAAEQSNASWLGIFAMVAEILTAGAVLRATGRIFLGWGDIPEATSRGAPHIEMDSETGGNHETPFWMWAPALLLLVIALTLPLFPRIPAGISHAIANFQNSQSYQANVLGGTAIPAQTPVDIPHAEVDWRQLVVLLGAFAVAAAGLFPRLWGPAASKRIGMAIIAMMRPLRAVQSGKIGDYVAWFVLGIAGYGGFLLLLLRKVP